MSNAKFEKIVFPSFEELIGMNNDLMYSGCTIKKNVADGLYALIECVNNQRYDRNGTTVIKAAWCTKNEVPIACANFPFDKYGYRAAVQFLTDHAKRMTDALAYFGKTAKINKTEAK